MGKAKDFISEKVMGIWGNVKDFNEPEVQKKARLVLRGDFLKSDFFAKNTGLWLLSFVLLFLYVSLRYYVEDDIKKIAQLQNELKELRIESITRSSELMEASKRSSVAKSVKEKGLGLTESREPPMLIK